MKKFIVAMLIIVAGVPVFAQDDLSTICMNKGGVWNADSSQCQYYFGIDINIDYPLELVDYPNAQKTIDNFITATRDDFMKLASPANAPSFNGAPNTMKISYEVVDYSDAIKTYVFTIYEYTGGAHGNTTLATFTFNLTDDTVIPLSDLFADGLDSGLAAIAPMAAEQVNSSVADYTDSNWVETGTAPTADNYANFALSNDTLYFYFPPYQVAAYVVGTFTVKIPLSDVSDILNPEIFSSSASS